MSAASMHTGSRSTFSDHVTDMHGAEHSAWSLEDCKDLTILESSSPCPMLP